MTGKLHSTAPLDERSIENDRSQSARIVAVGNPSEWLERGNLLPREGVAFVDFNDITEETLDYYQPNIVFSPILAKSFDCIELAMVLHNHGFAGQYRAMAGDLPNPALIEREVRQLCPHLDFQIVVSV